MIRPFGLTEAATLETEQGGPPTELAPQLVMLSFHWVLSW